MVEVHKHKRTVALRVCEPQHSATQPRSHLCLRSVVQKIHRVIVGLCLLPVMGITGAVAGIRIFMCPRFKLKLARSGHKQKISKIRYARTVEMRQRKSQQSRVVVLVTRCRVIVIRICVRTDLNTAKRNLRSGISISETRCTHQWFDILRQIFSHSGRFL